jgi:hypothetical protein
MPVVNSDQGGPVMIRGDRRRRIDAVIDYFGESSETRATRSRTALAPAGAYLSRWRGSPKEGRRGPHSGLVV